MKDPAIVFYTSDFMVGVSNLTMEERGQYITLLCLQHQLGHLSKKTIDLNIKKISQDVLEKFVIDEEGNYYNERLEFEIQKRAKFIEHQRENGQKGGRPKKPKENPNETQIKPKTKPKEKPLENEIVIDNNNINNNNNSNNSIYDYIEENFNRLLNPIEYEEISNWEDNELTRYAIKQAILNGAYNVKYITRILDSYKQKNITTVQQAQEDEKKFKSKSKNQELNEEREAWINAHR